MKRYIIANIGIIGGAVSYLVGGFDNIIISLMILMAVDFIMGILSASFGNSKKSKHGGISSKACFKGICKKVAMLLLIIVGVALDKATSNTIFRNALIFSLMANELISITENMALCGVPMPNIIKKALDILNNKSEN